MTREDARSSSHGLSDAPLSAMSAATDDPADWGYEAALPYLTPAMAGNDNEPAPWAGTRSGTRADTWASTWASIRQG